MMHFGSIFAGDVDTMLDSTTAGYSFLLDPQLMKVMSDRLLVLEKPVDSRLIVHRLLDGFRGRLPICFKQDVVIDLDFRHAGIEPHRNDNPQIIGL